MADTTETTPRKGTWISHPELPIGNSELFIWPPSPLAWLRWLRRTWLAVATTPVWAALAFATWYFLMPPMSRMADFAWDWVLQLALINLVAVVSVAGGLHLYFYTFGKQGDEGKFDPRGMQFGKNFTFGHQLWDNMFWTLASGVPIWTAYQVLYFWLAANGHTPLIGWVDNPVWFVTFFALIPIWSSMHFYFVHRALHFKPLYQLAHALHHRNPSPGPWTGISMHPIEHVIYFSSVIVHFIVPSSPIHFIFHHYIQALNPPCSHSGFDAIRTGGKQRVAMGDFFHQLHHRYFECNYGTAEMPWDKWFGSFHDGTPEATKRMRKRQRGDTL